ncbi:MAG: GAF domain-containing protein [Opitutales bacterium]
MKTASLDESTIVDALYRIVSVVGQTNDPREALRLILDEVLRILQGSSASVSLINPDTNCLQIETYRGLPSDSAELQLPIGVGVTGWVALHAEPLLVRDVREEPRYLCLKESIRSEMAVPMLMDNQRSIGGDAQRLCIGVVNVDSDSPDAFSQQDLKVLTLLTGEATRVVNRIWQVRQLEARANQLQSLIRSGQELVSRRDLPSLLRSIVRQARVLMGCRLCTVFLLVDGGRRLELGSVSGVPQERLEADEDLSLDDSVVGVAVRLRKQVEVLDMPRAEENHLPELTREQGLVSLLVSPIIWDNEVIGLLNAYTDRPHRFNNDEKQVFATLASLSAVAIQNSRLYARVFASEESLRKNERLTTLGLLAAEIAHEIRNPLTVIKLLFDSITLDFAADDARQNDAAVIREKLAQLEEIVERVLSFGRSSTGLHTRWALCQAIDETLRLVRLKLEQSKVELHFETPSSPVVVEGNKGQIQQALLNLILNAVQAMPEGGVIRVAVQRRAIDGRDQGVVSVSDTGPGVPEDLRERIFESFLTSKKEGTGLGLALVKRILKSHRGDVELAESAETGLGTGATFRFWLPCV